MVYYSVPFCEHSPLTLLKIIAMKKILLLSLLCSFLGTACSQQQKTLTNTNKENPSIENYIQGKNYENYEVATFAGGCFWCIEAAFSRINGVEDAISGYSGGEVEHPTYSQVGEGNTGHAESVMVYYDPEKIDFKTLLQVFLWPMIPVFLTGKATMSGLNTALSYSTITMPKKKLPRLISKSCWTMEYLIKLLQR